MVTVTDALGQVAINVANVTLQINPTNGPIPVINDGATDVNVTAGGNAALNNNGTTCSGACTTFWDLSCPDERGSFVNRSGDSIIITVGSNPSFDVDAAGATAPFNCGLVVAPAGAATHAWRPACASCVMSDVASKAPTHAQPGGRPPGACPHTDGAPSVCHIPFPCRLGDHDRGGRHRRGGK